MNSINKLFTKWKVNTALTINVLAASPGEEIAAAVAFRGVRHRKIGAPGGPRGLVA
jgi:hypothetical protein